jgi:hypothetical protein
MEDKAMARYMVLWEVDTTEPRGSEEKKSPTIRLPRLVRSSSRRRCQEWVFSPGMVRLCNFEGSAVELRTLVSMWVPFADSRPEVMMIDEVIKATKALPE